MSRRLNRKDARAAHRVFTPASDCTVINLNTGEKRTEKALTASEMLDVVGHLAYREQPYRNRQRSR